jgi:hypothetical protein
VTWRRGTVLVPLMVMVLALASCGGIHKASTGPGSATPTSRTLVSGTAKDGAVEIRAFETLLPGPSQGFSPTYEESYPATSRPSSITQAVWMGHDDTAYLDQSAGGMREVILGHSLILCSRPLASWSCNVAQPGTYSGAGWDTDLVGAVPWLVTSQVLNLVPTSASVEFSSRVVGSWKVQCLQTSPSAWPATGPTLSACITLTGIPVTFSETGGAPGTDVNIALERLSLTLPQGAFTAPEITSSDASTICTSSQLTPTASQGSGAASHMGIVVALRNGGTQCSLDGYPTAWFVDAAGHRLGDVSVHQGGSTGSSVLLPYGGLASTTVWTADPGMVSGGSVGTSCQPERAAGIDLTLPGQVAVVNAPIVLGICTTNPATPWTTPVVSGTQERNG